MENQNQPTNQEPVNFTPTSATPSTPFDPPKRSNLPKIILIVFIVLFLAATATAVYLLLQNQSLKQELSQSATPTPPIYDLEPTVSPDPTAGWQTYTNTTYRYALNFPDGWEAVKQTGDDSIISLKPTNQKEIPIIITSQLNVQNLTLSEIIDNQVGPNHPRNNIKVGIIEWTVYNSDISPYKSTYYITANDNNYITMGISILDESQLELYQQILSTFKFTDGSTSTTSTTSKSVLYAAPNNWTRTTFNGLSLCLPPKWEVGNDGIYFNRDAAYRPLAAYIQEIPYTTGSRREAYFRYWENEYPNARNSTTVTEVDINESTALFANGPENEKIIWLANNKLWQMDNSGWEMVNDSKTDFLHDIYTMISCSF